MKITEEMIRALQQKIDISYEDAERYLQKAKGDVDIAVLLYKEKQNSFSGKINSGLGGFLKYRIVITREGRLLVDLPIALLLLLFLINSNVERFFIIGVLFVIALIAECEFKIEKRENETDPYNGFTKTDTNSTANSTTNSATNSSSSSSANSNTASSRSVGKTESPIYNARDISEKENPSSQLANAPELVVSGQVANPSTLTPEEAVDINDSKSYNKKDGDKDDYYEIVIEE
ncbi:MAG: hypothetical protein PF505_14320 [Vallitaleaceae bacterium]|nr:hypothetical protein [Vallitaleaceae bacterium]